MTYKIMSLTYDKNFVDNTDDPDQLDPTSTPCIKFTAVVVDKKTGLPPADTVTVHWWASRDAVAYYDRNGTALRDKPYTTTDSNGIAEVYTTCSQPAFPTIHAEPVADGEGPMTKTVVFYTVQDNSTSDYSAPYFNDDPIIMTDEQDYAIIATVDRSTYATDDAAHAVAWLATRDPDGKVVDKYLLTKPGVATYHTLCTNGIRVPYEYMRTQDRGDNVLQYMLNQQAGSATVSQWGPFTATGTAYAMPDPSRAVNAKYPKLVYLDKYGNPQSMPKLTNDDFYKIQGSLVMQFQIPSWINGNSDALTSDATYASTSNANDIVDIYMYLNGYLLGSNVKDSKVVHLGSYRYGDLENGTLTIRKSTLIVCCASLGQEPGNLLFTYLVNDIAWSPDTAWPTTFTGNPNADIESECAERGNRIDE